MYGCRGGREGGRGRDRASNRLEFCFWHFDLFRTFVSEYNQPHRDPACARTVKTQSCRLVVICVVYSRRIGSSCHSLCLCLSLSRSLDYCYGTHRRRRPTCIAASTASTPPASSMTFTGPAGTARRPLRHRQPRDAAAAAAAFVLL